MRGGSGVAYLGAMKALLPLALIALLASCKKDDVSTRVRVECWKCTATVNGETTAVSGSREWNLTTEHGTSVAVSACRAPNDTLIVGIDTTITVYSDALSAWVWFNHEKYATESEAAMYPQPCVELTASEGSGED